MKRIWLYNLVFTGLLCLLFLLVNYTVGVYGRGAGFFLALTIAGLAAVEVAVCAVGIFLRRKRETRRNITTAAVSCLVPLLFLLFIWNFLFISC